MTKPQLKERVFPNVMISNLSQLHLAVIDEVCEKMINNQNNLLNEDDVAAHTRISYLATLKLTKNFLLRVFTLGDTITLNYRETTTVFGNESEVKKLFPDDIESDFDRIYTVTPNMEEQIHNMLSIVKSAM